MDCTKCGAKNESGVGSCAYCGNAMKAVGSVVSPGNIEQLPISEDWKKIFRLISENSISKATAGVPYFNTPDERLAPYKKIFDKESIYSFWAFGFGFLYYLVLGMWKKAIVIAVIVFVGSAFLEQIIRKELPIFVYIGLGVWWGGMAKYDYYRKMVLKEDFWW